MSKSRNSNRGFSLLEVVLAVGILSVGIVAILQAFSFSARVTGLSLDIIEAVFITEDNLESLEFKERTHTLSPVSEHSQKEQDKFEFVYSISDLGAGSQLYLFDSTVSWSRSGRGQAIETKTYFVK